MNKWASTDHTTRLSLLKEEVANSVLTFAEIVTDYFIRQGNFTIFPSYCSRNEMLLKVSYDNKVAELYLKPYYIDYLLYEKYGSWEQESYLHIEQLNYIVDWLKQPPSYIVQQIEKERMFRTIRGYSSIPYKKAVEMAANNATWFCNFEHPLEGRDHHWQLVEWLNS